MIEIVLLTYNKWYLTHQVLMDLKNHRDSFHRVTVVNNGSTDTDVSAGIKFWHDMRLFKVTELHLPENRGFVGGANAGLQYATCDTVILLSNDVRIKSRSWVHDVGALVEGKENDNILVGSCLYDMDTGWNCFGGKVFPYLSGHALAASNSAWERLGYFDTRYYPYDYEDVDLSTKAISLGFELAVVPGIEHSGGGTLGYNSEREAQTKINQKKFEDKWLKKN